MSEISAEEFATAADILGYEIAGIAESGMRCRTCRAVIDAYGPDPVAQLYSALKRHRNMCPLFRGHRAAQAEPSSATQNDYAYNTETGEKYRVEAVDTTVTDDAPLPRRGEGI